MFDGHFTAKRNYHFFLFVSLNPRTLRAQISDSFYYRCRDFLLQISMIPAALWAELAFIQNIEQADILRNLSAKSSNTEQI